MTSTVVAVDSEHVLQEESHDLVRGQMLHLFVTLSAGNVESGNIRLAELTIGARVLSETLRAGTSCTFGTFSDVWQHQHADWALKVLRLDTDARLRENVLLANSVLVISVCLNHNMIL